MGYYRFAGPGSWLGIFNFIAMLLFMALIVVALIFILRRYAHSGDHNHLEGDKSMDTTALKILNERFARGEIEINEYKERKEALENKTQ